MSKVAQAPFEGGSPRFGILGWRVLPGDRCPFGKFSEAMGCIWGNGSNMMGAGLDSSCNERLDHDLCPAMDEKRGGRES